MTNTKAVLATGDLNTLNYLNFKPGKPQLEFIFELLVDGTHYKYGVNLLRGIFIKTLLSENGSGEFQELWNKLD